MSITFERDISVASVTFQDGTTDETNDYIIIVESTSNTARIFNAATGSQVGGNISVTTSPRSITMIDSASAVIGGSGSTVDFLDTSSGAVGSISGGSGQSSTVEGQKSAADTSNKVAVLVSNTSRTLVFVDGNTFTATTTTMDIPTNVSFSSIVYKSSGRFIAGTNRGRIYEIDSSGNIVDMGTIGYNPSPNYGEVSGDLPVVNIQYLAYQDGYLTATTEDGVVYVMDWTTKTILHSHYMSGTGGVTLSNASSGIVLMSRNRVMNSGSVNTIGELDFTLDRSCRSNLFTDSTGQILALGINTTNGRGWCVQEVTDKIRVFTVSPRESTTRTLTTPNGLDSRIIVLDYTNGVYGAKRVVDTISATSRSYRVPSGKTLLEIVFTGEGTNRVYSVSTYTT